MCNTCGCDAKHEHNLSQENSDPLVTAVVEASTHLMSHNNHIAAHNREAFRKHNVLVVNLMSSPGAGKTSLLERTIEHFNSSFNMAVIEGDLETENDALRIRNKGVQAEQISTGSGCHLDATMIEEVLPRFSLKDIDILFIENVGNLICPASFDLGQEFDVVLLSVPEGDDKPEKYPVMFRTANLMLINKVDFLPLCQNFSIKRATISMQRVGNGCDILETSCSTKGGLSPWFEWLQGKVSETQRSQNDVAFQERIGEKHVKR